MLLPQRLRREPLADNGNDHIDVDRGHGVYLLISLRGPARTLANILLTQACCQIQIPVSTTTGMKASFTSNSNAGTSPNG